jgi:hypothetical protein
MRLDQSNSALRICVDCITHGQINGRVYGQRLARPLIFGDIGDMLLQIDDVLNAQNYPRAFQRKRRFGMEDNAAAPPLKEISGDLMSKDAVEASRGEIFTFSVNIIARQNTSWQGYIDWLDGSRLIDFRSALEFIRIVSDVLKKHNRK